MRGRLLARRFVAASFVTVAVASAVPVGAGALLGPGGRIAGHVRDPWGDPLDGVSVTKDDPEDGADYQSTVTAADGSYAFEDQSEGDHKVVFAREGLAGGGTTVHVSGDTVLDMTLAYQPRLPYGSNPPPVRTADGDAEVHHVFVSPAPRPGTPGGAPHTSCVWARLTPDATPVAATYADNDDPSGFARFTLDHVLAQGTPEGVYVARWWIADCARSELLLSEEAPAIYSVDNTAPSVTSFGPRGFTRPDTAVTVQGVVGDADIDRAASVVTVDGQVVTDRTHVPGWELAAPVGGLARGEHTATVVLADAAGNTAPPFTFRWVVDDESPVLGTGSPQGVTANRAPQLAITATDAAAGLDAATAAFSLTDPRGETTTHAATLEDGGRFTARRPAPLVLDGRYRVRFTVRDAVGNVATTTWTFEVRGLSFLA